MDNKAIQAAIENLKSHPILTLLALVLLITIPIIPQLPEAHRLFAFMVVVISIVIISILFVKIENKKQIESCKDVNNQKPEEWLKFFPAPKDGNYNFKFYDFFKERLSNAKQNIYITGEGIECADDEERKLAKNFIGSMRYALSNGISLVRIQLKTNPQKEWATMLAQLVQEFPDSFHLYVIRNKNMSQMSSICLIDPDDKKANIVEIMLSTQKLFGVQSAIVAGSAIFIGGNHQLCRDMLSRIISLTSPDVSVNPKTYEDTLKILCEENN